MKLMHLSDLHLGRMLHRYSLQEEQTEILEHIVGIARDEKPDAVLIAGDVYDRGIPPVYAMQQLDRFLTDLLAHVPHVLMISGNHDSAERVGFLSSALAKSGLHVSPAYRGDVSAITLCDQDGPVDFWLLPFVKAATVRACFPEENIESTNDAVACAIRHMQIDTSRRNVLLAHQFVTGAQLGGSEESLAFTQDIIVGGSDMVSSGHFSPFDYTALGHIHQKQNVGSERIRYSGTPLPYSFSERMSQKAVTMVDLAGDRTLKLREIPLTVPRNLQEVHGSFDEVTAEAFLCRMDRAAYTHVILTDEQPVPDVMARLRQAYPYITHLDWDNTRTRTQDDFSVPADSRRHTPLSLFEEFFQRMGGTALSPEQEEYMQDAIRSIWEEKA